MPTKTPSVTESPAAARRASLKEALRRSLADTSAPEDLRAFGLDELTCVVRWRTAGHLPLSGSYYHAELRLRRGERCAEHETTLADLSLLRAWCEHHLLFFDLGGDSTPQDDLSASGADRSLSEVLAAARARLGGDAEGPDRR